MKGFRKSWLCTVKPRYVDLMKSGHKTVEVRSRVPRDLKKGDGLYIMEKGSNTLALVARVGGITTYERVGMYTEIPLSQLIRTCLTLDDIDEYLHGRPRVNLIEISSVWIPLREERKFLTPEFYGYRCMPQGILPIPGKWKP